MINIKRPKQSLNTNVRLVAPNLFNIAVVLFAVLIIGFLGYIAVKVSSKTATINRSGGSVAGLQTSRVTSSDLLTTLSKNSNYKYFFDALTKSGEYELLKESGPYTVFIPDDNAFKKLGDLELSVLFADPQKLKELVDNHIIPGTLKKLDLNKVEWMRSIDGKFITVEQNNFGTYFNKSKLMSSEIEATNGVIFEIDTVLN